MALVSQALNTTSNISVNKNNLRNFYKMSEISEIESVDYDSRPGSYVRSWSLYFFDYLINDTNK